MTTVKAAVELHATFPVHLMVLGPRDGSQLPVTVFNSMLRAQIEETGELIQLDETQQCEYVLTEGYLS